MMFPLRFGFSRLRTPYEQVFMLSAKSANVYHISITLSGSIYSDSVYSSSVDSYSLDCDSVDRNSLDSEVETVTVLIMTVVRVPIY